MSGANATTPTAPRGRPADSAYFRWLLPRLTTDNPPRQHSWSPPRVPAPSTAPSTPRDVSWERRSRGNSLEYSPVDHRRQSSWGNVRSPTTAMSSRSRLRHSGLSRERHASGEITPDEESDDDPDGDADDDGEEGSGGRDLRGSTIAYRDYDSHVPSVNGGGPQSSKGRTQKRGVEVNGSCPEEEPSIRGRSQALQQSPRNARTRRRALLPDWLTGYHSPSEQNGRDQRSHDHGSPILAKLKPKNAPEALSFLKLDAKLNAATNLHPDLERKESEPKFPTHQFHPVLILENSGSVARDHLANERTFLAYVRTSLSIASTGVGLVQLFSLSLANMTPDGSKYNKNIQRFARPLGAVMVILGLTVLAVGFLRFFRVQTALVFGSYPPARSIVTFMSSVVALVVAIVFGLLVATPRR